MSSSTARLISYTIASLPPFCVDLTASFAFFFLLSSLFSLLFSVFKTLFFSVLVFTLFSALPLRALCAPLNRTAHRQQSTTSAVVPLFFSPFASSGFFLGAKQRE